MVYRKPPIVRSRIWMVGQPIKCCRLSQFVSLQEHKEKTSMYLVMGITGKVGGATARHLLKQGKEVRALVRNREKAAKWADRGVDLVDGDWNESTAIAEGLKDVE